MNDLLNYTEACFVVTPPEPGREILMAELAETGFESFEYTSDGLKAWVRTDLFDNDAVEELVSKYASLFKISFEHSEVVPVNWNEEWEKNYPPVVILDRCMIRAPFHDTLPGMEFDIQIEPKMSFGTAHHDTTALMLEWLLEIDTEGRSVLDMGCGTGVLAVMAAIKGAERVVAMDNYIWACQNTVGNAGRNGVESIETIHGDAETLSEITTAFDLILANINRNVLLEDIKVYVGKLQDGGMLITSGYFEEDESLIDEEAATCGLVKAGKKQRNRWCSVCYKKLT